MTDWEGVSRWHRPRVQCSGIQAVDLVRYGDQAPPARASEACDVMLNAFLLGLVGAVSISPGHTLHLFS